MATLSAAAKEELTRFIQAEGKAWVEEYISLRKSVLTRRGILASGDLQDSFAYNQGQDANATITNTLELVFNDYGRYVEMKRMSLPKGGTELIDALAEWIVKKGLEAKMTRDFVTRRKLKKAPEDILTRLAWGMAVKRQQKYRRRIWYNKSKSAALTELFNRVAAGLPEIVIQELKHSLQNTL